MSIDLKYLVRRNKITLKEFLIKHNFKNYEELTNYCISRSIIPISKSEYDAMLHVEAKQVETAKKATKKTTRKASTTQSKTKRSNRTKRVTNS